MTRKILLITTAALFTANVWGQSIISSSTWYPGQGTVTDFILSGGIAENVREWGINPFGTRSLLWKAVPDANNNADGGWVTSSFDINHNKMYRFTIWLKKTNSNDGHSYFGCYGGPVPVTTLGGEPNPNPYFWIGDLPELNKWYLLVGYIHGSGDNSTTNYGAMYDYESGEKVSTLTDFKFQTTATTAQHRSYLYYDINVNDRQYFYAPRVEEVNGNELTISALLGKASSNVIGSNLVVEGKLGINTTPFGDYKLAVNGKIIATEIKVETGWADFVFEPDYKLRTLGELEVFIQENKHLPEIPTEAEVKENGISVGEMNAKLLQKIEELTLYTLQQQEVIEDLKVSQEIQNKHIESLKEKVNLLIKK